ALTRVAAYSKLVNQPLTPEMVSEALKDLVTQSSSKKITVTSIQEAVADFYGIQIEEFSSKKRTKSIAFPRQIAMYLARELTDYTLPKIGEVFGGRDHSTDIHAHETISTMLNQDEIFKQELEKIENKTSIQMWTMCIIVTLNPTDYAQVNNSPRKNPDDLYINPQILLLL